jgi:DNA damage-binding protein 1
MTDHPLGIILDTHTQTILISVFTGFLFAIPFQKADIKGKSKDSQTKSRFRPIAIRTNEFDFLSMIALRGIQQSTMAVLLGEANELKTIKAYKYVPGSNEMVENEKTTFKVESTTHTLIAVPDPIGGVLCIGEYIIAYHDLTAMGIAPKELSIDPVVVTAYTFLDNSYELCVLGDQEGNLYMLSLEISNMRVNRLSSSTIGMVRKSVLIDRNCK